MTEFLKAHDSGGIPHRDRRIAIAPISFQGRAVSLLVCQQGLVVRADVGQLTVKEGPGLILEGRSKLFLPQGPQSLGIYIAAGSSFDKWSWTAILPEQSVSSVSVEVKQKPSFKTKNASGSPWIGFTLYFPFFSAHAKARLIICLRGHFAISIRSTDIMPLEWYLPIPSFLEAKVWSLSIRAEAPAAIWCTTHLTLW